MSDLGPSPSATNATILADEGVVLLPCEPDQFSNFIAGLLGQQQTLERKIVMTYDICRDDVVNIYYLIFQRVSQQNSGALISLSIKILFNDQSSVTVNSIEQFQSFVEVNDLVTMGLEIKWIFLVRFNGKSIPERQTIFLGFSVESLGESASILSLMRNASLGPSPISIRIEHTDRTWGVDIDNLLVGHLSKLEVLVGKIRRFILERRYFILAILLMAVLIATLYQEVSIVEKNRSQHISDLIFNWNKMPSNSLPQISAKIDYLVEEKMPKNDRFSIDWAFVGIVSAASILMIFLKNYTTGLIRPSFILVTSRDEIRKGNILRGFERNWLYYIGGCLVALVLGVVGNIITPFIVGS